VLCCRKMSHQRPFVRTVHLELADPLSITCLERDNLQTRASGVFDSSASVYPISDGVVPETQKLGTHDIS
jgi:hypothetical protein